MIYTDELLQLRRILMNEYVSYIEGVITEKEYLMRVKPIDMTIGKFEMATLQDIPGLKEAFLQHAPKLKH